MFLLSMIINGRMAYILAFAAGILLVVTLLPRVFITGISQVMMDTNYVYPGMEKGKIGINLKIINFLK